MKLNPLPVFPFLAAALPLWTALPPTLHAQGPLTPPGAPAPTMKTLDQVEPRTDLATVAGDASAMHVINAPGSYYLSGNLDVTTTNGIEIEASGVTVDLMGFSIFRSGGGAAIGTAILFNAGGLTNVAIKNGHITSGVIYDSGGVGDQFTGPGFGYGIFESGSPDPTNVRVSHVHVAGVDVYGIYLSNSSPQSNTVEHSSVKVAGSFGILASEVHHCTAITCGSSAIVARGNVTASRGNSVGFSGDGIFATGNVSDSYGSTLGTNPTADGIDAGGNISNSYGTTAGGDGIECSANCINSYGRSSGSGTGITASYNVINSYGDSDSSDGISADNVSNSYGFTTGSAVTDDGIDATRNVSDSWGESDGGDGIEAGGSVLNSSGISDGRGDGIFASFSVMNSFGQTGGDDGIEANLVENSHGVTQGTAPTANGIDAGYNVSDSYGVASGGDGIEAGGQVSFSTGESTGSGAGIVASGSVMNCYGESASADGISSGQNVSNSTGITTGTGSSDDGIDAFRNVSHSYGQSTGGDGIESGGSVLNSYANTDGAGDGISATLSVMNSFGGSDGDDGIDSPNIVSYSRGFASGTATGVGIECTTAVGCIAVGGESITNKYLMP